MNIEDNINQNDQNSQEGQQQTTENEPPLNPQAEEILVEEEAPRAFAKGGGKETLYRVTVMGTGFHHWYHG